MTKRPHWHALRGGTEVLSACFGLERVLRRCRGLSCGLDYRFWGRRETLSIVSKKVASKRVCHVLSCGSVLAAAAWMSAAVLSFAGPLSGGTGTERWRNSATGTRLS